MGILNRRQAALPSLVAVLLVAIWMMVGYQASLERERVLDGRELELSRLVVAVEEQTLRLFKLTEASALVAPFFLGDDVIEIAADARAQLDAQSPAVLDAALHALGNLDDHPRGLLGSESDWAAARIEEVLREAIVQGLGVKPKVAFGPLRTAVAGQRISPPLFESMEILGKTSTLARLQALRDTL